MIFSFDINGDVHPRLAYTVDFINKHPLKPENIFFGISIKADRTIAYGANQDECDFLIPKQGILFSDVLRPINFHCNPYTFDDLVLYSVEVKSHPTNDFLFESNRFGFDILETIFYHISRYEEYVATDNNPKNGWLSEEEHFLVRHQIEQIPVVDHLLRVFFELLTNQKINRPTTFSLSHDIDVLYRYKPWHKMVRSLGAMVYHQRGWNHVKKSISQIINGEDPYDVYDWLFRGDNSFTSKRIYLMTGGETRKDNLYNFDHPKVISLIHHARQKGYLIGLHPSYNAAVKAELFEKEKEKLELKYREKISLSRQHWLHWHWEKTPASLTKNGIFLDSSLGYSERLGFRCGTGYEYQLYDFTTEKKYIWSELPLVYMESSLIYQSKRTGTPIRVISNSFLSQNEFNTHIEMNWHNSNFDNSMRYGEELCDVYKEVVMG